MKEQADSWCAQAECNETPVYVLSGAGSKQVTRHLRMKVRRHCRHHEWAWL
jgi:hypothetical protein